MIARCNTCGAESAADSADCLVCGADLGAASIADDRTGSALGWSLATTGVFALVAMFGGWRLLIAPALFYGPMIAAWRARRNATLQAAAGGLLIAIAFTMVAMVIDDARATFGGLLGTTSAARTALFGIPIAAIVTAPICLCGAAVGEVLAQRRRAVPRRLPLRG